MLRHSVTNLEKKKNVFRHCEPKDKLSDIRGSVDALRNLSILRLIFFCFKIVKQIFSYKESDTNKCNDFFAGLQTAILYRSLCVIFFPRVLANVAQVKQIIVFGVCFNNKHIIICIVKRCVYIVVS